MTVTTPRPAGGEDIPGVTRRHRISDLYHETGSTNFFVIDTHFRELLQRLLPVEVEVSKRLFCSSFFRTSFLRP